MPLLVDLTEQELAELKTYTHADEDAAAVRMAMTEYLRLARRLELKGLSGQVSMEENWQSLEASELKDHNGGAGTDTH